jgi:hypothetical protein
MGVNAVRHVDVNAHSSPDGMSYESVILRVDGRVCHSLSAVVGRFVGAWGGQCEVVCGQVGPPPAQARSSMAAPRSAY